MNSPIQTPAHFCHGIHYVKLGNPDNDPILFLHGFPEFWYQWRKQLSFFSKTHFCLAIDFPGFNWSDRLPDTYSSPLIVRKLEKFIKSVFSRKVTIVAHDLGSIIAFGLASQAPNLVKQLIIFNGTDISSFDEELRDPNSPQERMSSSYIPFLIRGDLESKTKWISAFDFFALKCSFLWPRRFTASEREAYIQAWKTTGRGQDQSSIYSALQYYRSFFELTSTGKVSIISPIKNEFAETIENMKKVPTTVVWGNKDRGLAPGLPDRLRKHIDRLDIIRNDESGHWIVHEMPDLVNRVISEKLNC